METLAALSIAFGSFCYQMAEAIAPNQCQISCQCADQNCDQYTFRMDHQLGQSAFMTRPGGYAVDFQVDGINSEKIYRVEHSGQELRIRHELMGQKIKAIRFRTAKSEIYCGQ